MKNQFQTHVCRNSIHLNVFASFFSVKTTKPRASENGANSMRKSSPGCLVTQTKDPENKNDFSKGHKILKTDEIKARLVRGAKRNACMPCSRAIFTSTEFSVCSNLPKTRNFSFYSIQRLARLKVKSQKQNANYDRFFLNCVFDKGRLKALVLWFLQQYGQKKTIELLERLKKIGFGYATKAGISLGIDDLGIPAQKRDLLIDAQAKIDEGSIQYERGEITGIERFQRLIDTWHQTSENLKQEVVRHFEATDLLNPVYMMAFSGARGNISQVRQLVGMRGLMADPQGRILDFPIRSNFREGLTLTEYLISSYGARKGIVDTALRTANAGYLTRRLVDVAQHVIVCEFDCQTNRGILILDMKEGNKTIYSFQNRLLGRVLAKDIFDKRRKIAAKNQEVCSELASVIAKITKKALIRSPLTCETKKLVCQLCYGWSLATNSLVSIGEAVGIIAAQSIGEPGTQLTMRTFHTGGVFSGGFSDQIIAQNDGIIEYSVPIPGICIRTPGGRIAFLTKAEGRLIFKPERKPKQEKSFFNAPKNSENHEMPSISSDVPVKIWNIPPYTVLFARNKQKVFEKQIIAQLASFSLAGEVQKTQKSDAEQTIYAEFEGQIYNSNIDVIEKFNEYNDLIFEAWTWGYLWILAGKIYQYPMQSRLFAKTKDFVGKNSILNRVQWVSANEFFLTPNFKISNESTHSKIPSDFSKKKFTLAHDSRTVELKKTLNFFQTRFPDKKYAKPLIFRSKLGILDRHRISIKYEPKNHSPKKSSFSYPSRKNLISSSTNRVNSKASDLILDMKSRKIRKIRSFDNRPKRTMSYVSSVSRRKKRHGFTFEADLIKIHSNRLIRAKFFTKRFDLYSWKIISSLSRIMHALIPYNQEADKLNFHYPFYFSSLKRAIGRSREKNRDFDSKSANTALRKRSRMNRIRPAVSHHKRKNLAYLINKRDNLLKWFPNLNFRYLTKNKNEISNRLNVYNQSTRSKNWKLSRFIYARVDRKTIKTRLGPKFISFEKNRILFLGDSNKSHSVLPYVDEKKDSIASKIRLNFNELERQNINLSKTVFSSRTHLSNLTRIVLRNQNKRKNSEKTAIAKKTPQSLKKAFSIFFKKPVVLLSLKTLRYLKLGYHFSYDFRKIRAEMRLAQNTQTSTSETFFRHPKSSKAIGAKSHQKRRKIDSKRVPFNFGFYASNEQTDEFFHEFSLKNSAEPGDLSKLKRNTHQWSPMSPFFLRWFPNHQQTLHNGIFIFSEIQTISPSLFKAKNQSMIFSNKIKSHRKTQISRFNFRQVKTKSAKNAASSLVWISSPDTKFHFRKLSELKNFRGSAITKNLFLNRRISSLSKLQIQKIDEKRDVSKMRLFFPKGLKNGSLRACYSANLIRPSLCPINFYEKKIHRSEKSKMKSTQCTPIIKGFENALRWQNTKSKLPKNGHSFSRSTKNNIWDRKNFRNKSKAPTFLKTSFVEQSNFTRFGPRSKFSVSWSEIFWIPQEDYQVMIWPFDYDSERSSRELFLQKTTIDDILVPISPINSNHFMNKIGKPLFYLNNRQGLKNAFYSKLEGFSKITVRPVKSKNDFEPTYKLDNDGSFSEKGTFSLKTDRSKSELYALKIDRPIDSTSSTISGSYSRSFFDFSLKNSTISNRKESNTVEQNKIRSAKQLYKNVKSNLINFIKIKWQTFGHEKFNVGIDGQLFFPFSEDEADSKLFVNRYRMQLLFSSKFRAKKNFLSDWRLLNIPITRQFSKRNDLFGRFSFRKRASDSNMLENERDKLKISVESFLRLWDFNPQSAKSSPLGAISPEKISFNSLNRKKIRPKETLDRKEGSMKEKIHISIQPGWVYYSFNPTMSRFTTHHQKIVDSGKFFVDDLLFTDHRIYVKNINHLITSNHSSKILNTSRMVENQSIVSRFENSILKENKFSIFVDFRTNEFRTYSFNEKPPLWSRAKSEKNGNLDHFYQTLSVVSNSKSRYGDSILKFVDDALNIQHDTQISRSNFSGIELKKNRGLKIRRDSSSKNAFLALLIRPMNHKILPNLRYYETKIHRANKKPVESNFSLLIHKNFHSKTLNKQKRDRKFISAFPGINIKIFSDLKLPQIEKRETTRHKLSKKSQFRNSFVTKASKSNVSNKTSTLIRKDASLSPGKKVISHDEKNVSIECQKRKSENLQSTFNVFSNKKTRFWNLIVRKTVVRHRFEQSYLTLSPMNFLPLHLEFSIPSSFHYLFKTPSLYFNSSANIRIAEQRTTLSLESRFNSYLMHNLLSKSEQRINSDLAMSDQIQNQRDLSFRHQTEISYPRENVLDLWPLSFDRSKQKVKWSLWGPTKDGGESSIEVKTRSLNDLIKNRNRVANSDLIPMKAFLDSLASLSFLPRFDFWLSAKMAYLANQRLFAPYFVNRQFDFWSSIDRRENAIERKSRNANLLQCLGDFPISTNRIGSFSSNRVSSNERFATTSFLSPLRGEVIFKSFKNGSFEPYKNRCLILTESDLFCVYLPNWSEKREKIISVTNHSRESENSEDPSLLKSMVLEKSDRREIFAPGVRNKFSHLYRNFLCLDQIRLDRASTPNVSDDEKKKNARATNSPSMENLLIQYDAKLYKIKGLKIEAIRSRRKLRLGSLLVYGDVISPTFAVDRAGQIIHMNCFKLTFRRAQPISVSPKGILHAYNRDFVGQNAAVITLPFQTLKTGDIVQGIPKVEQYFEARTTKRSRLYRDSLPNLLQALFERYKSLLPLEKAVRQSFLKIQQIIVDGVQRVYRSQGVSISDKHLEVIVRQMTSKVQIMHGGQTGFFPGELVDLEFVEHVNRFLLKKIRYEPIVLGITRSSLEVESFLSAASFQQTAKVLSKAAVYRQKDFLKGLKENIIVGNLIPGGTGYFAYLKEFLDMRSK